jgi:hypothetical protein
MAQDPRSTIQEALVITAAYYNQNIPDRVLVLYTEDLIDLPPAAVVAALVTLRREPGRRFCPLPGDVRRLVAPDAASDIALANEIAGRISTSMSRHGYTNPQRAETAIGPVGWRVVGLMGGWTHICQTTTVDDARTFYAQCRDLAKAQLELDRVRRHNPGYERPELEGHREPAQAPKQLGAPQMMTAGEVLNLSSFFPR